MKRVDWNGTTYLEKANTLSKSFFGKYSVLVENLCIDYFVIYSLLTLPITVAEPSMAWTVSARSNAEIVG
jgi:hypothetical protein